jgi:hypothetical protein
LAEQQTSKIQLFLAPLLNIGNIHALAFRDVMEVPLPAPKNPFKGNFTKVQDYTRLQAWEVCSAISTLYVIIFSSSISTLLICCCGCFSSGREPVTASM